jgi:hypothetical protein
MREGDALQDSTRNSHRLRPLGLNRLCEGILLGMQREARKEITCGASPHAGPSPITSSARTFVWFCRRGKTLRMMRLPFEPEVMAGHNGGRRASKVHQGKTSPLGDTCRPAVGLVQTLW